MSIHSRNNDFMLPKQTTIERNCLRNICRKISCWSKYQSITNTCAFLIFTGLLMTVGILTVYFTSPKESNRTCQFSFENTARYTIGYDSHPKHVTIGDFNNDDYLDIVVSNSGSDNIGIFFGYGNGTFHNQITYSTGFKSQPYSIDIGDFNKDNQSDIVVAHYGTNSIGVFLGYGNRTFQNQILTSLGSNRPLSLTTGDFNNDNQLDIALVSYGTSNVIILQGFNNGSFQIDRYYYMGYDSIPYSIIVNNFNNDKNIDIAIVNYGTSELVIILTEENKISLIHKYSTGSNSHPCSLATGDFNNDNRLDLAVANSDTNNIGIFLGNDNGTFTNIILFPTGLNSHPHFIIVNDLNNDTKLDIIVIDSNNNNVIVFEGNGNGNFSIITIHSTGYNSNPSSMIIGDFDSDNKSDIVISNNATNNILVLTEYDIYPVTNQTTYTTDTDSRPISVTVGDFNNDNFSDIVVANSNTDNVGLFINLGNGTFRNQTIIYYENGSMPYFVIVNDINNDNQLDIMILMNKISEVRILLGYGNGSFRIGDSYSTGQGSDSQSIAVGDLNGDNNLDIIVANNGTHNIGVFFGYGDGTFTNITKYFNDISFSPKQVVLNDLNNDKILDIVTCDYSNGGIVILLGYGNGSFWNSSRVLTYDESPIDLGIGDLNNDQQLDIIYTSPLLSNIVILLGDENGTFQEITKISSGRGSWPYSITLGHFNNDTLLDMAITYAYGYSVDLFFGLGNGSFALQKSFSTGYESSPCSLVSSDLNNDNQLDIVVANRDTNNIGVFLIHYEADFAYETSYFTGSGPHPYSVAIGHFNNNDQSDVVVANSGNDNIQLLHDYNNRTFISNKTYSTGFSSSPQFVTVADFNRDNQSDIIVANYRSGTINIFLKHTDGTFDTPIIYSTNSNSFSNSIAVGDLNKDNWQDIIVANYGTNNLAVFLGFDYATFTNQTIRIPGSTSNPYSIISSDFNNDHYCDIAVVKEGSNDVGIYLGYGNGTFAEERSFSTGISPISIATGDFNDDNQLDLIVTNSDANSISIFCNFGNGSFQPEITYSTGNSSYPCSVAVGDFNKDNILDIVVANRDSDNIGIFIGYGNGTFTEQKSYFLPNRSHPSSVAVDDLNKDNILDIVVANYGQNNIGIFFGYGNASFRHMIKLLTGEKSGPYAVDIADFNDDKLMDIAVANRDGNNVGIFFGSNDGNFSSQKTHSTGSQSDLHSILFRDLNNDTVLDIIVSDYGHGNGNIGVFYGYGDGNFTKLKTYATGWSSNPVSVATCDFNNDNQLDLAIAYKNTDSIGIMLRYKSEPFATPILLSTDNNSHPKSVAIDDFNNDNHLDIAVANSGTNNIGIFLGYGNGTFSQQKTYPLESNSEPVSITVGDFNNDSYIDIVIVNSRISTIVIFRGYGDGTFTVLKNYSTGIQSFPSSIAVKDLNKDNYLDIVVTNFGSNEVIVFLGSRDGTFLELKSYSLGYNARPQSVTIGDINNDNMLDIIVANYGTDYVEILLQTC